MTIIPNHILSRAGGFDFIRCQSCGKDNRVETNTNGGGAGLLCQSCDIPIELKEPGTSPGETFSDPFSANPYSR